jgi:hypothetical protein
VVVDDTAHVRQQNEIDRLTAELTDRYRNVSPDLIGQAVQSEFTRRSEYPVQDFVPIFAARSLRGRLRESSS